jgi:hypothetical protein
MSANFVKMVAESLRDEDFTLIDIGCSGGIDRQWRLFGDRLVAVGFDASVSECQRLTAEETNPNVHYVAGFVDIPPNHPFAQLDGAKWRGHVGGFYQETSSAWTLELRGKRLTRASDSEKWQHNMWGATELADPNKPLYAPEVLSEMGISDVDVLKIDVDGPDFRILNSFDGLFNKLGIIAARMEVNLFGGPDPRDNVFHNTDRFMRQQGYDLVRLDCYSYSKRALPAPYNIYAPTHTLTGRLFQAEAHYALVPSDGTGKRLTLPLSAEKLVKLAAVYSIWNQPDGAAEILVEFRDRIAPLLNVDAALDLLAAQTQVHVGVQRPQSYRDYMALFATDAPYFFPTGSAAPPALDETLDSVEGESITFLTMARLQEGATVRSRSGAAREPTSLSDVTIDTTTVPYVYSMLWSLDTAVLRRHKDKNSIVAEVSLSVGAGRLGILWVDEEFQPLAESERYLQADPHPQQVLVSAPVSRARHLIFRNFERKGLATSFCVKRIRTKITVMPA